MNGFRISRWSRRAVWGTLVGVLAIGCNPLTLPFVLFGQKNNIPAEYPLKVEDEKRDKDQEVLVAVLVTMGPVVNPEFAGLDRDLASQIAKKMPEEAKLAKQKIAVVPQAKVEKYKASHPGWRATHPSKIGKELGADFVIDIALDHLGLYQAGTGNQLYEGKAEVGVDVYDVSQDDAEPRYKYVYPYIFPRAGVMTTDSVHVSRFRMLFLERLALELVWKHTDRTTDRDITPVNR